jgi:apolipoprotein N-acyltransferase
LKRFTYLFVALAGSILLWAAWPMSPLTFLIFIAWFPLLWIEDRITRKRKLFALTYLHMLLWNVLVTWWVWNASPAGSLGAFFANSLIMCIPWLLFHITKKSLGRWIGYGSLIIYWITFEYIHHNWDLSWPWLTLGNAFATHPDWVQWYEFTGTTGGSLWILLSNVLIYSLFREYYRNGRSRAYFTLMISWLVLVIVPNVIYRGKKSANVAAEGNIVIVQPNIDPYIKFQPGEEEKQLQKLISLSESAIDSNTILVVWPETAIPVQSDEDKLKENAFLAPIWNMLAQHPRMNLLSGVEGYRMFHRKNSIYSRSINSQPGIYYESYNSAAIFDSSSYSIYHKSKLVPGVEILPSFLKFMDKLFEKFGGTTGGYAPDKERRVLVASNSDLKIAPAICYESIYSDFMTGFIRKGANIICVITNDGWWGNTPGHKQHLNYARLRAIETRRWIVRSANTGISCFIDDAGRIINPQAWDTSAAIKLEVPTRSDQTFFVRHGDYISRAMAIVSMLLILLTLFFVIKKQKK